MDRTKIIACLSALLSPRAARGQTIVVGSKNFTEQVILGEILAQQIERTMHVPVERYLDLGGTLLVHEALVQGSIDLYPEYTGTALTAVLKRAPEKDAAKCWRNSRGVSSRWKLAWLPPLGFNDTFAMIVRGETARSEKLVTLSDAARAGPWRLGAGPEFQAAGRRSAGPGEYVRFTYGRYAP